MIIMWFSSLRLHLLLHNFAETMYFITQKMCTARADQGHRAADRKGQEKATALAVSTKPGKFLFGHTPYSLQLPPLQGKEGRKGMAFCAQ